ncbi:Transposase [Gulbenkiania indica]|uniref:Transposase n=1 Tax=Gulbenkiania indica TaxID=375574 RepID=A0A0K6H7Y8_9NEIS|nr:Transposase [Gulbenkiania indica]
MFELTQPPQGVAYDGLDGIVAEVSALLGVSSHSLYKWVKAVSPDNSEKQAAELIEAKSEILHLKAQLRRTEEERDILKKAARYFARESE